MQSAPHTVIPVVVSPVRRARTLPASLRDLDYATWHAHIAGITALTTSTRPMPERQEERALDLAVPAARLERPAA
jgi:hypothetical protein